MMKTVALILIFTFVTVFFVLGQKYPGNNIVQLIKDKEGESFFVDPIDDTINYKHVIDNIYEDKAGRVYILNISVSMPSDNLLGDTTIATEYFRDYSDFIEMRTYRLIKGNYFINKHKVYLWFSNSGGTYPVEIEKADFKTFRPFDTVCGGTDINYVFYGSPQNGLNIRFFDKSREIVT